MGENTAIEWASHTFNPWWGCVKVSPACDRCYAETFAKRVGQDLWGPESPRRFFGPKHWSEPLKWNRDAQRGGVRRRVFCASMADVFEFLPTEHPNAGKLDRVREDLWRLIEATPHLDWLLLTKRPQNMARMAPERWRDGWPTNVIAMTTVENQHYADVRIPELLKVPAKRHGISVEPLLGPVDLRPHLHGKEEHGTPFDGARTVGGCISWTPPLSWVIVGGESGHGARPMHPAWVRSLRNQCIAAGVPFLFKQWGEHHPEGPFDHRIECAVDLSGRVARPNRIDAYPPDASSADGWKIMRRVGKKAAGRLLDGRTWDEFPEEVA